MSFMRATDGLSIAALPDPLAAQDACELAWHLRDVHRLTGTPLLPGHMHSALWYVEEGLFAPPAERVDELVQRLSGIDMRCLRISFDHAVSLGGDAFVLAGRSGVAGLEALQGQIGSALRRDGRADVSRVFNPHVTLLRDKRRVARHELASPIEWEVSELVLLRGLAGKTLHHPVARLPLKRPD